MDALEYLNQVKKLQHKLEMQKMSCLNAEAAVTQTTSWVTPTSEVHAHRQDAREIAMARYMEKKEQVEKTAVELELKRNEILELLEKLPDDRERMVLEQHFVYLRSLYRLFSDSCFSRTAIKTACRDGIKSCQALLKNKNL